MPIYVFRCDCGYEEEIYRSISNMDNDLPECCGKVMKRKICAPYVVEDIKPYKATDGTQISGRRAHKEHLKKNGLIEVGNEWVKPKKREYNPKDLKADIADVVNNI